MDSRKKKASFSKSEKMNKFYMHIKQQVTDLNNRLLTIADMKWNEDAGEILLSWNVKRPELIGDHVVQNTDDCWAHAFARGLSSAMKQHGATQNFPTAKLLVSKIDRKFLTATYALPKSRDAAPSLKHHYGCTLVVNHRPKLELIEENEEFEKFIERRLATNQVAMCFPYVHGYTRFNPKDKEIFRPSVSDIQAMIYESLDNHYSVITGRGVVWRGGEAIEFWEIQETRGKNFGDGGFTRLERHKGLISEVYEFRL